MQEMNDFYLETLGIRMRRAELQTEADRERMARRLTAHRIRFVCCGRRSVPWEAASLGSWRQRSQ